MSDSESETDIFTNNVFTFQNHGTTISAKGPNINTKISSLSFHNMNASNNVPWNGMRPRYAESVGDQRSMSYRRERELSPMSCRNDFGRFQPRSMHSSYYHGGINYSRSGNIERSGSPASIRTIDSNTSLSAKDIAFAFRNGQFNKFDFKIIKDAYNKFLKGRVRKRVERKRNIRTFLKGFRRRSGGDSGDQASDSSISSDDCRSVQSSRSVFKENMSSSRSTKTDVCNFRSTMKEGSMFRDRTANFRLNSSKKISGPQVAHDPQMVMQNTSSVQQKDRFRSGFLLPSQRFNQSAASSSILERSRLQKINEDMPLNTRSGIRGNMQTTQNTNQMTDSGQEEIFGEITVMERNANTNTRKRNLDEDENIPQSERKRNKLSSPRANKIISPKMNGICKQKSNDFVFAKPQFPVKKPTIVKNKQIIVPKILITPEKTKVSDKKLGSKVPEVANEPQKQLSKTASTSHQPIEEKLLASSNMCVDKFISESLQGPDDQTKLISKTTNAGNIQEDKLPLPKAKESESRLELTQQSTTDLSMRPSFIKRKLFSQKVDVGDKNSSSDSVQAESPQTNIYSKIQKEKTKARKLATQSCLNRDVLGDDSNLLDLIHKVVPPDQMNATTVTNKTEPPKNSRASNNDKWDVTSVINSCNDDDLSDTYTDEDIFTTKDKTNHNKQECAVVVEKLPPTNFKKPPATENKPKNSSANNNNVVNKTKNIKATEKIVKPKVIDVHTCVEDKTEANHDVGRRNVYKSVRTFWDTDAESDFEATPKNNDSKEQDISAIRTDSINPAKKIQKPNTIVYCIQKRNSNPCRDSISTENVKGCLNKTKFTMNTKLNCNTDNKKESNLTITERDNHFNTQEAITKVDKSKLNPVCNKQSNKIINNITSSKKIQVKSPKKNKSANTATNPRTDTSKLTDKKSKPQLAIKQSQQIKNGTKIKSNINNNDIVTSKSAQINSTLSTRTQRKPKVQKCCEETSKLNQSMNSSGGVRSLRSRDIDVSMTKTDNAVEIKKKSIPKNQKPANNKNKGDTTLNSDISFTLTLKGKQTSGTNKSTLNLQNKSKGSARKSDVSFSLLSDKSNTTILTRSSFRKSKELESLHYNTLMQFKNVELPANRLRNSVQRLNRSKLKN